MDRYIEYSDINDLQNRKNMDGLNFNKLPF